MRSLYRSAAPISFGTRAIAWLAVDNTQPVVIAVTVTAVPTPSDTPSTIWPLNVRVTRAPSEARSRTQTEPVADAWIATTVNAAPAEMIITGAAMETAIGNADSVLAFDAFDCACALVRFAASIATISARRIEIEIMVLLLET